MRSVKNGSGADLKSVSFLKNAGADFKLIHFPGMLRTAADVARVYGCDINNVLKSLVFAGKQNNVLVVLPGDRRVDLEKLHAVTGKDTYRSATPEEVLKISGYPVGGVSPFGTKEDLRKIIDKSVFDLDVVNMGSGDARTGIEMKSYELKRVWDGIVADVIAVQ